MKGLESASNPAQTQPRGRAIGRLLAGLAWIGVVCGGAELPADHAQRMERSLRSFENSVRGLLVDQCLRCHGGDKIRGGFDLSTREGLLRGGDEGPGVVPFDARASKLLRLLRHEEKPFMPEKASKLPDADLATLAAWIDDGAAYEGPLVEPRSPGDRPAEVSDEDRRWWSFAPLAPVHPPLEDAKDRVVSENPIDRFLSVQAARQGLTLSPRADKRTLIRRAYLDLLGFPPPPEAVDAFLADASGTAWPDLVDKLLQSPHYGERWGRHWLDVARFAESSGFEHDYDREGAFHYRDFVIKALNRDMPFDQFVRWQLAGDEVDPDDPLGVVSDGISRAGVFPTQITANEVERTRYDAMDDMLATTSAAFLGMSVGCARCHDHKYDPIPNRDYYRMLSVFTTTVRSVIDLDLEPQETLELIRAWETQHALLVQDQMNVQETLRPEFDLWLGKSGGLGATRFWTLLDLNDVKSKGGATFSTLPDGSVLADGKNSSHDEYTLTGTTRLQRVTGLRLEALTHPSMKKGGPGRAENGNFALSRVRVFATPAGGGAPQEVALVQATSDFEQNDHNLSVSSALDAEPTTGWAVDPQVGKDHVAVFTFGKPLETPDGTALTVNLEFRVNTRHTMGRPRLSVIGDAVPSLEGEVLPGAVVKILDRIPSRAASLSGEERETLFDWWKQRQPAWQEQTARIDRHRAGKPDGRTKVLVCAEGYPPLRMNTQGADFFEETYFLKRGDTDRKNGVATPGYLQVLMRGTDPKAWGWQPPNEAKFSGRRRSMANWLTDVEHGAGSLLARVAVNRLWQHHFGTGIVATPNDFGRMGALPTHPELLDWLAGEFIHGQWRLKPLHRLLMTSAAYQQSGARDPARESIDPANHLFARWVPRRLEAEAIRDSLLAVSGVLDPTLYGPGTRDERSRRRSIYFTMKRSQLMTSMVSFDQPEPLVSQGLRPTTTVAPQALLLINGPQVREWATAMASRVEEAAGKSSEAAHRIHEVYARALGRPPTREELGNAEAFLENQARSYALEKMEPSQSLALVDFCQVLFGLNEFAYQN